VLVNGAAVISLLTFVGQVWANDQRNGSAMAHILFWPLLLFLTGLVLAVATTLLAYVTQMITAESGVAVILPPSSRRWALRGNAGIAGPSFASCHSAFSFAGDDSCAYCVLGAGGGGAGGATGRGARPGGWGWNTVVAP